MDVDVFMRYMAGALHSAKVELTDKQWEAVSHRLHEPLPKLGDGQLFAYSSEEFGGVQYEMYIENETDLEEYPYARPLTQQEMGKALGTLVSEYRKNGFGMPYLLRFEEEHPFN
jgi:hypothetical protein